VVLLLEGDLVSCSLAMDEYGGHEDLCGSGRRSIIPYVHRRTELYCSSLPYLSLPFCPPCEEVSTRSFYSSGVGAQGPGAPTINVKTSMVGPRE
jgi:hypothetical protein